MCRTSLRSTSRRHRRPSSNASRRLRLRPSSTRALSLQQRLGSEPGSLRRHLPAVSQPYQAPRTPSLRLPRWDRRRVPSSDPHLSRRFRSRLRSSPRHDQARSVCHTLPSTRSQKITRSWTACRPCRSRLRLENEAKAERTTFSCACACDRLRRNSPSRARSSRKSRGMSASLTEDYPSKLEGPNSSSASFCFRSLFGRKRRLLTRPLPTTDSVVTGSENYDVYQEAGKDLVLYVSVSFRGQPTAETDSS